MLEAKFSFNAIGRFFSSCWPIVVFPCHVLLSSAEERNADTFFHEHTEWGGSLSEVLEGGANNNVVGVTPSIVSCIWRYPSARGFEGPHVSVLSIL